jgi:hypothetical protein
VYWIHVEMVYGFVSRPLHRALSLRGSLIACVAFGAFLYGLVLLKNRFATRFRPTSKQLPNVLPKLERLIGRTPYGQRPLKS